LVACLLVSVLTAATLWSLLSSLRGATNVLVYIQQSLSIDSVTPPQILTVETSLHNKTAIAEAAVVAPANSTVRLPTHYRTVAEGDRLLTLLL
jgi:hypothetical protein